MRVGQASDGSGAPPTASSPSSGSTTNNSPAPGLAAQDLRLIFQSGDRSRAEQALYRWLAYCADADIPELTRLARTIDSWHAPTAVVAGVGRPFCRW